MRELVGRAEIHGLAHITGGGAFLKLERILGLGGLGADLDQLPEAPGIFQLIMKEGRVSDREMYRTFNMGVGLVVVCPEPEVERTIRVFKKHRQEAMRIGIVGKRRGVRIKGKSLK